MREAKLELTVISYSAGISACEKGEQWQRALALLSEIWEVKLEPDVISYSAGISACKKGKQWQWALALLSEMREAKLEPNRDAGGEAGARRHQLQRWDQLVQERRAVAMGMREAKLEPNVISFSAGISACEKGEEWQWALALLSEMASSGSGR
ncbi:unnamed protein product [Prorocentrum cordatum]|uniref:Pentatricopeptide repeat-containing protein, chloroplastic n=1 Tax=Prorocentrum cordatum TaxID=2364126 RepID=A0ABN9XTW9_9DINO|nr:unnamed protein product [Polarella glacialis]